MEDPLIANYLESKNNMVEIGAWFRTSKYLSDKLIRDTAVNRAKNIVELGAGDGAVTKHIVENMPENAILTVFEKNKDLYDRLEDYINKFEGSDRERIITINDSVENMDKHIDKYGISNIDSMISTLPWSNFTPEFQEEILSMTNEKMNSQGIFGSIAYFPGNLWGNGREFPYALKENFEEVYTSFVLRNLPPSIVYNASKPLDKE